MHTQGSHALLSPKSLSHAIQVLIATAALAAPFACAAQEPIVTPWGDVAAEPALPAASAVCAVLPAKRTPVNGSLDASDADPSASAPDTADIQFALDHCGPGKAVKLVTGANGATGLLTGPLTLRSGITLWIDQGVTLFASRNPKDYDNGAGLCGIANKTDKVSCYALLNGSHLDNAGIVGAGIIDGRGGSLLTGGANKGLRSWWDVAYQTKTGSSVTQHNPRLLNILGGNNFTLYGITLQNSPNFHAVLDGIDGVLAWNIKILSPSLAYTVPGYACPKGTTPDAKTPATCFTPDTVKNTDGFDPGESTRVVLAYSYISTGDDHVAVKAGSGKGSQYLLFAHDHLYYGHGLSIGSETNTGVSDMTVEDLVVDGHDSPNGVGIRIKSDVSRGGAVSDVVYRGVCMRNVRQPLVFDAFYSSTKTKKSYPSFTGIEVHDFHDLGSVAYGGGQATFEAYASYPLRIVLDNVQFDGAQPATYLKGHNGGPGTLPANTAFSFGPGPVSFAKSMEQKYGNGVSFGGAITQNTAPRDCSTAFVPMSSVLATAPL
ncbi:glycoside hydrolase family 28 protein [Dyella sp. LX-66]|uniref:glycoside hydrolase family 28 protein n=1 Tax=unclassified Dyella TaxID=2634549 RepID=UPI001BE1278D|nr:MULTISPECIES: glycoside hydrolase family 28 protein [unclassified Dyella]MBT2119809.1 glycoside hydrolase family 28 protein [Dyella sp. LX-1]MBT2142286.1 glycoside hydrolase family 28 protein [Dyella sp. LX-66]